MADIPRGEDLEKYSIGDGVRYLFGRMIRKSSSDMKAILESEDTVGEDPTVSKECSPD